METEVSCSPAAVEVRKASVRFTSRTGESMFGAELLTKAGEEVGRVELVLMRRRSQESSSPRRFRQFGSIGSPRILFMPKEIGPWGVTLALLTMAK